MTFLGDNLTFSILFMVIDLLHARLKCTASVPPSIESTSGGG